MVIVVGLSEAFQKENMDVLPCGRMKSNAASSKETLAGRRGVSLLQITLDLQAV